MRSRPHRFTPRPRSPAPPRPTRRLAAWQTQPNDISGLRPHSPNHPVGTTPPHRTHPPTPGTQRPSPGVERAHCGRSPIWSRPLRPPLAPSCPRPYSAPSPDPPTVAAARGNAVLSALSALGSLAGWGSASAKGNRTTNSVPWPGLDVTVRVPLCFSVTI